MSSTPPMNEPPDSDETIFAAALQWETPAQRAAYLDEACAGQPERRRRVEDLLRASDAASTFLERPVGQPRKPVETAAMAPTLRQDFPEEPLTERPGAKIGRYNLLQQIGEGGCGTVFMAEQEEPVRRRVALKVIKLGMDTKSVVARFEAERQALAMMDHPNIAKVLDAGATDSGRPFFVMELVRGIPITRYCDENKLDTQARLDLFIQVCHAIQHAHQKGIIHRDIKPSNILVTLHDGTPVPKVIDFGIAKATEGRLTNQTLFTAFEQFIGTPAYMSPEQAEMSGLDIDTRSDIYALGVLLYELLTGKTPFDAKELVQSGIDAMRKTIREKEPQRPSTRLSTMLGDALAATANAHGSDAVKLLKLIRGDLDWIVMKCLEKDRTRRYETANGLAADLKRHLTNEPVVARPPSTAYRFQKAFRRNKLVFAAGTAVALALIIGLVASSWQMLVARRALVREQAAREREQVAQQRERTQSVRADTVTTFINSLVSDQLPLLIQQGNVRGARELIRKADALASSSLSNAPAAEITVRSSLWVALALWLNDMPAALQQAELVDRLLPKVSDDQLSRTRDELRIFGPITRLWAAGDQSQAQEQAMKELESLYAEFMGRTPPAQAVAAACRSWQAHWLSFAGKTNQAVAAIVEARELLLRAPAPVAWEIQVAVRYAEILGWENPAQAERFARETLAKIPSLNPEVRDDYRQLVGQLSNTLCRHDRFAEATAMLEEQSRWLKTHGGSPTDQVRLDALRGAVLARSGYARESLPILEAVATNRLSTVQDWYTAAIIAASVGDHASFERLSRVCWLRFGSMIEGGAAITAVIGLYQQPMDERTLAMARALLDRSDDGSIYSITSIDGANAALAYREHHYPEALALLDRDIDRHGSRLGRSLGSDPAFQARALFLRALLGAERGRADDARRDFGNARAQLKLALGGKPGHDRGDVWWWTYQAETRLHEAEAVFKAKGIPLPEAEAQ